MADLNQVLTAFRNELVSAGIIRRPRDAGPLPPMHVEPAAGAVAPRDPAHPGDATPEDDETTVLSIYGSELGEDVLDHYRRRVIIDVRYRSRTTAGLKRARDTEAAIRAHMVSGRDDYGLGWTMDPGGATPVFVLSSQLYAGLGRISDTPAGRDEVSKYLVEVNA